MLNIITFIRFLAASPILLLAFLLAIVATVIGKAARAVMGDDNLDTIDRIINTALDE